MFYEQDTILRMIAQLGAAFRRILAMLEDGDAEEELEDCYRTLCGLERGVAEGMDIRSLYELLPPDRLFALAELTHLRAVRFRASLDADVFLDIESRALRLLALVEDEDIAMRQIERMCELRCLCTERLTIDDEEQIVRFFVCARAYDRAEDVLFEALESYPSPEKQRELCEFGLKLYDRLAALAPEQLDASGLPQSEVSEGRAAIERIISKKGWNA